MYKALIGASANMVTFTSPGAIDGGIIRLSTPTQIKNTNAITAKPATPSGVAFMAVKSIASISWFLFFLSRSILKRFSEYEHIFSKKVPAFFWLASSSLYSLYALDVMFISDLVCNGSAIPWLYCSSAFSISAICSFLLSAGLDAIEYTLFDLCIVCIYRLNFGFAAYENADSIFNLLWLKRIVLKKNIFSFFSFISIHYFFNPTNST